jgi:anaerobic magnesium-protoporphyrin IX monomethyl ester cyclase
MMRNLRVLVMEPANQQLPIDTARPNGALGPAYLVGALRAAGIEADYYDGTVGWPGDPLDQTFFNRVELEHGTIRYGAAPDRLAEVVSGYDVVATSSIFTAQTRMHFEVAAIARRVAAARGRPMLLVAGGVNARALKEHFLLNGFDVIALGEGERVIVEIVRQFSKPVPDFSQVSGIAYRDGDRVVTTPAGRDGAAPKPDELPPPALEALPLSVYRDVGIPHAGVMPPGTMFGAIQTSRGCQDRCSFCHISVEKENIEEFGRIGFLREFSTARVAEDVTRAVSLGVTRLYFEDDNLFFSKKRLRELAPVLKRPGLEYSNVNGANLRFLFAKRNGQHVVDTEFIGILADFGLRELVMPFESRNFEVMEKYATGKYNPDIMDSAALVRALKDAGIRLAGNFMIGFHDEPWESVLRTRDFARELLGAGLDAVGFMIPVPYPGSLDFQNRMLDTASREAFHRDPLSFTDRMHWRAKPLFPTAVPGERLQAAIREFWLELNPRGYVAHHLERNVATPAPPVPEPQQSSAASGE